MADSILMAYATRYGSTQEVADRIAATLRESGLTVDVQPVKQVRTLDGYRRDGRLHQNNTTTDTKVSVQRGCDLA